MSTKVLICGLVDSHIINSHHMTCCKAIQSIGVSVNMQTSLNDYLMYSVNSEVLIVSVWCCMHQTLVWFKVVLYICQQDNSNYLSQEKFLVSR